MKKCFVIAAWILTMGLPLSGQSWVDTLFQSRADTRSSLMADPRLAFDADDLEGLHWFDPDSDYRVMSKVTLLQDQPTLEIPTYSGVQKPYRPVLKLEFDLHGQEMELTVYEYAAPGMTSRLSPFFLPFKDYTNSVTTYGGGRYINVPRGILQEDYYLLDFNGAYNPLCAYGDGFNCPVPPRENHLNIEILAGEMEYTGLYKHKDGE